MCHTEDGIDRRFGQKDMPDFQMRGNIRICSHVVYYYQAGMPTALLTSTHIDAVQYTAPLPDCPYSQSMVRGE